MAVRRSFKADDSFLEKLCIGAFGTKAVIHDLSRLKFRRTSDDRVISLSLLKRGIDLTPRHNREIQ